MFQIFKKLFSQEEKSKLNPIQFDHLDYEQLLLRARSLQKYYGWGHPLTKQAYSALQEKLQAEPEFLDRRLATLNRTELYILGLPDRIELPS